MNNDRPPIAGSIGRQSKQVRLKVCEDTQQTTIQPFVEQNTSETSINYTDESSAYNRIDKESSRTHHTVNHSKGEWARDDDNDGIREVHSNTMEGHWTGLRNYLRPFRGVHKRNLKLYVAIHQWAHNLKRVTQGLLRALLIPNFTYFPT
jgi:transposase-like protein